jgi:hypothetical protein
VIDKLSRAIGGTLSIGGLPSEPELAALYQSGRRRLVNVSGASLVELYGKDAMACFELSEFTFSDVFSEPLGEIDPRDDRRPYTITAPVADQIQFRLAVNALAKHLSRMHGTYVFCRQGVGRAPAVSLAAIHGLWSVPMAQAVGVVMDLRPQAMITGLSISAGRWYREVTFKRS